MRLAVFSDVHGNLGALDAVLRDASGRGVDGAVHLGDLVGDSAGGAGPTGELLRRLRAEGIPGVVGDADLAALREGESCALGQEWLDFLGGLPAQLAVQEGATRFLFAHASPMGPEDAALAELDDEALLRFLEACGADVLVVGHTHRPLARRVGGRLLLNPGSVGTPGDGDPRPSYLVLDTGAGLEVAHVRVQIGVERTRD